MKVLLDEKLPHELRHHLPGHEVFTVQFMGWGGIGNGALLTRAEAQGFDVSITMDSGVSYQQNLASLPVSVVIVRAPSNDMDDLRPLLPRILETLGQLQPRTLNWVS